jgi:hypothetical protein
MILTITCLAATELVMEFIWNSMGFHLMPNLIYLLGTLSFLWIFQNEMISSCHFISFLPNEMK